MDQDQQGRAVVIGGSVAGLLAARALADRFPAVIIVERDRLPARAEHRRGVPQARQLHALLAAGQRAVEHLLPGITADLGGNGAPIGDPLADMQVCFNGHRFRPGPSGLTLVSASRDLLEHHIRRRVLAAPGVTLLDHCDVAGLTADHNGVAGVRVLRRADHSVEELIDADVVVDATGRGSRLPVWLVDLGFPPPPQEVIPIDLGYATRCYRLPDDALDGAYGAISSPTAHKPRGLAFSRLENRWMLTLIGIAGDHPPTKDTEFDEFLATVADPAVAQAIRGAEPIDDPTAHRFPASRRRRYDKIRLPHRLLVVGDALCSFNPVYGQGVTVAALEALALHRRLTTRARIDTRPVLHELAGIVDLPWAMTRVADRPFLTQPSAPNPGERLLSAHINRVQEAAQRDVAAGAAFLRVSGLVDHPMSLLKPAVLRSAWSFHHDPGPALDSPWSHTEEQASCTPSQ